MVSTIAGGDGDAKQIDRQDWMLSDELWSGQLAEDGPNEEEACVDQHERAGGFDGLITDRYRSMPAPTSTKKTTTNRPTISINAA